MTLLAIFLLALGSTGPAAYPSSAAPSVGGDLSIDAASVSVQGQSFSPEQLQSVLDGAALLGAILPTEYAEIATAVGNGSLSIGTFADGQGTGFIGMADSNTILVRTNAPPVVVAARLLHEYHHWKNGGPLTPCQHAGAYIYTVSAHIIACQEGVPLPCRLYKNAAAQYFTQLAACGGAPVHPVSGTPMQAPPGFPTNTCCP